jgi:DNA repair protein RecO (recombination protein O)
MEDTYGLKAIVLFTQTFREHDSRVTIFSLERGKFDLTARGTKRIKSKLAGHLEPCNLVEIMAIKGKSYDYVGSVISENCFANIKESFVRMQTAVKILKIINQAVKTGEAEEKIFFLLQDFLVSLNRKELIEEKFKMLADIFSYKCLAYLGYRPELYNCLECKKKIKPDENYLSIARGGMICRDCFFKNKIKIDKKVSADCIKILRLAENTDLEKIIKIRTEKKLGIEVSDIISSFLNYHLTTG